MMAIGTSDIRKNLKMVECIDAMEDLYRSEAGEIALQPMRTLNRVDGDSLIFTMPSYSKALRLFAVKIVSEYKNNPKRFSLPVQGGIIVLIDAENSQPLAILDSAMLTSIRTGAVSGLATKLLSRKDAKSVAVVGSGQQARTLLEAMCAVRDVSEVRVFSRDHSHARSFAKEMGECLGVPSVAYEERRKALVNADIVILATNSTVPVLDWSDLSEGCHINSVGTLPERRELDLETVCHSMLYVDSKEGVLKEAGDVMHAIGSGRIGEDHVIGDLSDLLSGRCRGRQNDSDITLFKSVGFGLQDVYASERVYRNLASSPEGGLAHVDLNQG